MEKPSRLMPAYMAPEPRSRKWSILILLLILIWLSFVFYENPFLLPVIFICVSGVYYLSRKQHKKMLAFAEERCEESICDFAREFDCRHVDTWIIRAVYEELLSYLDLPGLSLRADDDLHETLQLDGDDLDMDLVSQIAQRTGRSLEKTENNPYYDKVRTVRDLVLFFNHQPINTETKAG